MSLSGPSSPSKLLRQFKDPVHTYFTFSKKVCRIIDTPHFQRLRKVKQLGTTYYVWPNASHNRFEHCLGVGYLAGYLASQLRNAQPELGITDRDVECLQIAGLCHDLGHGPWSHVFDGMFMPKARPGSNWQHEVGSEMMFDDLITSRKIPLGEKECRFVKALIAGDPERCDADEKRFLFDIVANKRNGLDVDKFDYIVRDSLMVGHKVNLDIQRIIGSARVIKDQICYDCKDLNNIYKIGENRFELHKMVYNHKTAKAIEYMIIDALLEADKYLDISGAVFDAKKYLTLTDSVMDRIEASDDKRLDAAKAIFERIHVRDLYRLTDFKCFPWNVEDTKYIREHITPRVIVETARMLYGGTDVDVSGLTEDQVIVDLTLMHYGMKEVNPLKNVRFYNKANPDVSFRAREGDYSTLRPSVFAEYKLQIYSKQSRKVLRRRTEGLPPLLRKRRTASKYSYD
ncbi:HD-domain/PDEase-like protein [Marasmius fiardii PR-910]|nr:HD-domain/PDEase-like protein [Marasmius fiardii PR-910]